MEESTLAHKLLGYLIAPRDHKSVLPVWTGDRPHCTFGLILGLEIVLVVLEIALVVLGDVLLLLVCM